MYGSSLYSKSRLRILAVKLIIIFKASLLYKFYQTFLNLF